MPLVWISGGFLVRAPRSKKSPWKMPTSKPPNAGSKDACFGHTLTDPQRCDVDDAFFGYEDPHLGSDGDRPAQSHLTPGSWGGSCEGPTPVRIVVNPVIFGQLGSPWS